VVTHQQILRELWGPNAEKNIQYLWVYISRLRQKLEADFDEPNFFRPSRDWIPLKVDDEV